MKIYQQIHEVTYQQAPNIVNEEVNTDRPETSDQNQMLSIIDRNATPKQTLTLERKINLEIMKSDMSEKKTTTFFPEKRVENSQGRNWKKMSY